MKVSFHNILCILLATPRPQVARWTHGVVVALYCIGGNILTCAPRPLAIAVVMVHADTKAFSETGECAKWDMVVLYNHGMGGAVPYYVSWRGENKLHPTARLAKTDANLDYVQVQVPSGNYASELLSSTTGVAVASGSPLLKFSIADTPKGRVTFEASNPAGIVMPGFGDDSHPSMNRQ